MSEAVIGSSCWDSFVFQLLSGKLFRENPPTNISCMITLDYAVSRELPEHRLTSCRKRFGTTDNLGCKGDDDINPEVSCEIPLSRRVPRGSPLDWLAKSALRRFPAPVG